MKKAGKFVQFGAGVAPFFAELAANNTKEWFEANRARYESEIKDVSKAFVVFMSEAFAKAGLDYVSDLKVSMFRINRDVRFSTNKDPYKTNMGFWFPYGSQSLSFAKRPLPGLYVHYSPEETFIATGLHMPGSADLKRLRAVLAVDFEAFAKILSDEKFKSAFPGEFSDNRVLTRVQGYPSSHPAFKFLAKKDHTFFVKLSEEDFLSEELPDIVLDKARASDEFNHFLYSAVTEK